MVAVAVAVESIHLGRKLCLLGNNRRLSLCILRQRLHLRHCLAYCSKQTTKSPHRALEPTTTRFGFSLAAAGLRTPQRAPSASAPDSHMTSTHDSSAASICPGLRGCHRVRDNSRSWIGCMRRRAAAAPQHEWVLWGGPGVERRPRWVHRLPAGTILSPALQLGLSFPEPEPRRKPRT